MHRSIANTRNNTVVSSAACNKQQMVYVWAKEPWGNNHIKAIQCTFYFLDSHLNHADSGGRKGGKTKRTKQKVTCMVTGSVWYFCLLLSIWRTLGKRLGQGLLTLPTGYWFELFQSQHFLISVTSRVCYELNSQQRYYLKICLRSFADLNSATSNAFFPIVPMSSVAFTLVKVRLGLLLR